jgi:SAM-dependent methyltransferase
MKSDMSLSAAWEKEAEQWIKWAREPDHDSYLKFHRDQFFELLPAPGKLTIDIGCGEGRLTRDLKKLGHSIKGFDVSPTLIEAARQADPTGSYEVAGAEALPLPNGCADLVVSFMVLHDVDDLASAVSEIGRILKDNGKACLAIVHPLNSAGNFAGPAEDSEFIIKGTYLGEFRYSDTLERNGLTMTFHSAHRSLERYSREFEKANLCIEAIREHPVPEGRVSESPESRRWKRLPLFLHFRVFKQTR